ncbi:hypothetical protein DFH07DRAFT_55854 [Mycena maculata]|uniref:Uncharacterized protein n=1 Tax=Mycena maculata TaxID=230809 RepID=A0AAD7IH37_9AGAR|nr:hypothetical protein DFH07DRAFT_55854 [Mycena maculata]
MRSLIVLVPLCAALLSTASPLGDRALFRKHAGAPLSRRFILSSRWDVPAACSAPPSDVTDNSTIPIPDSMNVTGSTDCDNSTFTAPIATDNFSTVTYNSTLTYPPVDSNATVSADNSTLTANSTVADNSTSADNSTATASKRYDSYEFEDYDFEGYGFEDAWFHLCMNSGGDVMDDSDPCLTYGINGYSALLAEADVCAQQENADAMITFAKSHGVQNSAQLIQVAVAYRKLPRESVQIMGVYPSTPYCGTAPVNEELMGVCNEQPEGVTYGLYGGPSYPIVPFGNDGSCPYGQTPDVETCCCVSSFYPGSSSDSDTMIVDATPYATGYTPYATGYTPYATDYTPYATGYTPYATGYNATAVEPSPTAVAPVSVVPPVETASVSASSIASAVSAAASGNITDPNGR